MLRYTWFSRLVRHPARKRSGSMLQPRSPHGADNKRCNFSFTHSKSSRNRAKDHVLPRYLSGVGRWFTYLNVLWRDCFILSLANYVYACSLYARTIICFSIGLLLFDLNEFFWTFNIEFEHLNFAAVGQTQSSRLFCNFKTVRSANWLYYNRFCAYSSRCFETPKESVSALRDPKTRRIAASTRLTGTCDELSNFPRHRNKLEPWARKFNVPINIITRNLSTTADLLMAALKQRHNNKKTNK